MKSLSLNVPDEQAQAFAKELATLMKKHGVEVENKEAFDSLIPIPERVKTFEDACKVLGESHPFVTLYQSYMNDLPEHEEDDKDVPSYLKLRIIVAALNEGWKPQFTDGEFRYYPWFVFYTQKELDEMDEEDKQRIRVLGRSNNNANANAGVGYSSTYCASSYSNSNHGGRLCFKDRALAEYAGKQFADIWIDFLVTL